MNTSLSEQIALTKQLNQMQNQDHHEQTLRAEYFGMGEQDSSRRNRAYGINEHGDYWEE
tara:strand:- start:1537 stop:1713 length:177 start_codon:yes stop_codon:yes gene_type:complete